MRNEIEIYVISGFLGSGKTTFMTEFLEKFSDKKLGILVNELGTVSIDGMLVEQNGIQMTEITNGSIYCYCKQGDFISVLRAFSTSDIDVLIIENSGMADPSNIHKLLKQGVEVGGRSYEYKGAICVLDSMTFLNHVEVLPSIKNQVLSSNFFVLNKVDMVNQEMVASCRQKVLELNPDAKVYETMYAKVPFEVLEQELLDNGYDGETTNKCYNKFVSYSLECDEVVETEVFQDFLKEICGRLYRAKGFVLTAEGWKKVDVVESHIEMKAAELLKKQKLTKTKFVTIGKDEKEYREWLVEIWGKYFQQPLTIYE